MIPTIALGDVHDVFVRRFIAVIPAIDMETRRIEMAERTRQPHRVAGGNEAVEFPSPQRRRVYRGHARGCHHSDGWPECRGQ